MKLRCQLKGVKCPRYKHHGVFHPDDKTIKRLLPDVHRCADCTARASPQRWDIQEDLQQTAVLVLIEKGPRFSPTHPSRASFRYLYPSTNLWDFDGCQKQRTHAQQS